MNKNKSSHEKLTQSFEDVLTDKELFIAHQNNCPLCGAELVLSHHSQYVTHKILEEAECSPCNIRLRNEEHLLH